MSAIEEMKELMIQYHRRGDGYCADELAPLIEKAERERAEFACDWCRNWRPVEASAPVSGNCICAHGYASTCPIHGDPNAISQVEVSVVTGQIPPNASPPSWADRGEASAPAAPPARMDRDLCRLSIISTWPEKDGCIEQQYPDRIIDRIMQIVDQYVADAAPKDQTQAIEEAVRVLREASRSLANEVAACTGMSEWELRGTLGNTNFTCLTTRMTEVRSALAALDAILPILRSGK